MISKPATAAGGPASQLAGVGEADLVVESVFAGAADEDSVVLVDVVVPDSDDDPAESDELDVEAGDDEESPAGGVTELDVPRESFL